MLKEGKERKKVLIGMTGGVDSTVAAYLLKKQGLDPIGVSFNFYKEVPSQKPEQECLGTCQIRELSHIQEVCEKLEIPFYGVNAAHMFKERILDRVLTARLGGTAFSPCVYCNVLKFDLLVEKSKKLGADFIATGHYAKVVKNIKTGKFQLISANDKEQDQSYYLSGLGRTHLEHLLLPCADIRRSEVERIAESLGISFAKKKKRNQLCFMQEENFSFYVKKNSPPGMLNNGGIFIFEDGSPVGDHDGVHNYYIGQDNVKALDNVQIDEEARVVEIDRKTKNIYISKTKNIRYSICEIIRYKQDKDTDISSPLKAFVQFSQLEDRKPCFLYFKNNDTVLLRFQKEVIGLLTKGTHVAVYNGAGVGAKIIGNGTLQSFGFFDESSTFRSLPDPEEIDLEIYGQDELELDLSLKIPRKEKDVTF